MNPEKYIGKIHAEITPPQGMTSTVTLFKAERGNFALKQSTQAPYTSWLQRETHVLKALRTTDLPVPRFVALNETAESISLLMSALPGEPLSALLCRGVPDQVRLDLLRQFGALLSKIHASALPPALQNDRLWLQRILEEGQLNLDQGFAEVGALPVEQMTATCPASIPEVLIHGDYTIDNVLVDGGKLTGVIDWGRGDNGDPRYDLALATRPQEPEAVFLEEADFVAFYEGYGGERLREDERQWFNNLYEYF